MIMATAGYRGDVPITLEQYAALPEDERWTIEAVRGRLVREPRPAPLHSRVQARLIYLLESHERAQRTRGAVLIETEFVLSVDPLTVRVPDVAWVSAARVPANGYELPRWHFAPDLAAEVVSPRTRRKDLEERVADYLTAGSRLVWLVDPRPRTVVVHRPGLEPVLLGAMDQLTGGDVLPAFSVPVLELFPD
jgi:Uma2 family endonuclease